VRPDRRATRARTPIGLTGEALAGARRASSRAVRCLAESDDGPCPRRRHAPPPTPAAPIHRGLGAPRDLEDQAVAAIGQPGWNAVRAGLIALLAALDDAASSPKDATG